MYVFKYEKNIRTPEDARILGQVIVLLRGGNVPAAFFVRYLLQALRDERHGLARHLAAHVGAKQVL